MSRGRKKGQNSRDRVFSIRITEEQYNLMKKNVWIKEDVIKQVQDYLNVYVKK